MIHAHRLKNGTLQTEEDFNPIRCSDAWLGDAKTTWFEATAPELPELDALGAQLGLHPSALRTTMRVGSPARFDDFGDYLFIVAHTPARTGERRTRKIAMFVAETWILTVTLFDVRMMEDVRERLVLDPTHLLGAPHRLVHAILDQVATGFERKAEQVVQAVTALESRLMSPEAEVLMTDIIRIRRGVVSWERAVRGQRDVCLAISRSPHAAIPNEEMPWFRDIHDHLIRVFDLLESARGDLGAIRDATLALANNNLSEVMRALTVIATVMMPLSLLAGIFGMNFEVIPGLAHPWGFWILMAAMAVLTVWMLRSFKRRGWL